MCTCLVLSLLLLLTTSEPLKIQSCCHLKSIDQTWNPSNQTKFYFELTVDNDPSTLQTSNLFDPPNGTSNTNIDETFCWEYDSANITITTFKPDHALNIQIKMRNSAQPLNIFTNFKHPQIITSSQPSFENKTVNSINFNLYHKISMTNTLLKISNRNFIIKRNCFELYCICFYEIDKSNPDCLNAMDSLVTKPLGAISTVFKDLSTTTTWTPTPDIDTGETCYEPYQQYVLFDISSVAFTSIGLGILQNISSDTIGSNDTAPRYWSFAFGDMARIDSDYGNDTLYDQYWVVDLLDSNVFINENTANALQPFFHINPLYFQLDTAPTLNRIRMDQIFYGRPEQYVVDRPLFRFGGSTKANNERDTFTTWTWIGSVDTAIWDDGSPTQDTLDNQTFKIGQYAQIACKNAINYDINNTPLNTYYLSSIKPTSINDKCYGTGITPTIDICVYENQIYYPPMAFRLEQNYANSLHDPPTVSGLNEYCQENITNVNHFAQCKQAPSLTKECAGPNYAGVQCDASGSGAAADDAPYAWECVLQNVTQINTAFPTPTPSKAPTKSPTTPHPTISPTLNPTKTPTLAPYTPGTPSRSPITSNPSANPSITPTHITNNPSRSPTTTTTTTTIATTTTTTTTTTNAPADPGPGDDDTIINIYNFNIGLVEIIIVGVILCICCCLLLLLLLLRSKKKQSKEESEILSQESQKSFQHATYHQSTRQSFNVTATNKDEIQMESQYTDVNNNTKGNVTAAEYKAEYDYDNYATTGNATTGNGEDKALDMIAGIEQTPQKYSM